MTKNKPKLYRESTKPTPAPMKPPMVGSDSKTWAPLAPSKQSNTTPNTLKQNLYKDSTNPASEEAPGVHAVIVGKDKSSWGPVAPSEIVNEKPIGDDPLSWSPLPDSESNDQTAKKDSINNNRELYQSHEDWRRAAEEKEGPKLDAEIEAFTNKEAEVWETGMAKSEDQSDETKPSLKKKKKKNNHKKAA